MTASHYEDVARYLGMCRSNPTLRIYFNEDEAFSSDVCSEDISLAESSLLCMVDYLPEQRSKSCHELLQTWQQYLSKTEIQQKDEKPVIKFRAETELLIKLAEDGRTAMTQTWPEGMSASTDITEAQLHVAHTSRTARDLIHEYTSELHHEELSQASWASQTSSPPPKKTIEENPEATGAGPEVGVHGEFSFHVTGALPVELKETRSTGQSCQNDATKKPSKSCCKCGNPLGEAPNEETGSVTSREAIPVEVKETRGAGQPRKGAKQKPSKLSCECGTPFGEAPTEGTGSVTSREAIPVELKENRVHGRPRKGAKKTSSNLSCECGTPSGEAPTGVTGSVTSREALPVELKETRINGQPRKGAKNKKSKLSCECGTPFGEAPTEETGSVTSRGAIPVELKETRGAGQPCKGTTKKLSKLSCECGTPFGEAPTEETGSVTSREAIPVELKETRGAGQPCKGATKKLSKLSCECGTPFGAAVTSSETIPVGLQESRGTGQPRKDAKKKPSKLSCECGIPLGEATTEETGSVTSREAIPVAFKETRGAGQPRKGATKKSSKSSCECGEPLGAAVTSSETIPVGLQETRINGQPRNGAKKKKSKLSCECGTPFGEAPTEETGSVTSRGAIPVELKETRGAGQPCKGATKKLSKLSCECGTPFGEAPTEETGSVTSREAIPVELKETRGAGQPCKGATKKLSKLSCECGTPFGAAVTSSETIPVGLQESRGTGQPRKDDKKKPSKLSCECGIPLGEAPTEETGSVTSREAIPVAFKETRGAGQPRKGATKKSSKSSCECGEPLGAAVTSSETIPVGFQETRGTGQHCKRATKKPSKSSCECGTPLGEVPTEETGSATSREGNIALTKETGPVTGSGPSETKQGEAKPCCECSQGKKTIAFNDEQPEVTTSLADPETSKLSVFAESDAETNAEKLEEPNITEPLPTETDIHPCSDKQTKETLKPCCSCSNDIKSDIVAEQQEETRTEDTDTGLVNTDEIIKETAESSSTTCYQGPRAHNALETCCKYGIPIQSYADIQPAGITVDPSKPCCMRTPPMPVPPSPGPEVTPMPQPPMTTPPPPAIAMPPPRPAISMSCLPPPSTSPPAPLTLSATRGLPPEMSPGAPTPPPGPTALATPAGEYQRASGTGSVPSKSCQCNCVCPQQPSPNAPNAPISSQYSPNQSAIPSSAMSMPAVPPPKGFKLAVSMPNIRRSRQQPSKGFKLAVSMSNMKRRPAPFIPPTPSPAPISSQYSSNQSAIPSSAMSMAAVPPRKGFKLAVSMPYIKRSRQQPSKGFKLAVSMSNIKRIPAPFIPPTPSPAPISSEYSPNQCEIPSPAISRADALATCCTRAGAQASRNDGIKLLIKGTGSISPYIYTGSNENETLTMSRSLGSLPSCSACNKLQNFGSTRSCNALGPCCKATGSDSIEVQSRGIDSGSDKRDIGGSSSCNRLGPCCGGNAAAKSGGTANRPVEARSGGVGPNQSRTIGNTSCQALGPCCKASRIANPPVELRNMGIGPDQSIAIAKKTCEAMGTCCKASSTAEPVVALLSIGIGSDQYTASGKQSCSCQHSTGTGPKKKISGSLKSSNTLECPSNCGKKNRSSRAKLLVKSSSANSKPKDDYDSPSVELFSTICWPFTSCTGAGKVNSDVYTATLSACCEKPSCPTKKIQSNKSETCCEKPCCPTKEIQSNKSETCCEKPCCPTKEIQSNKSETGCECCPTQESQKITYKNQSTCCENPGCPTYTQTHTTQDSQANMKQANECSNCCPGSQPNMKQANECSNCCPGSQPNIRVAYPCAEKCAVSSQYSHSRSDNTELCFCPNNPVPNTTAITPTPTATDNCKDVGQSSTMQPLLKSGLRFKIEPVQYFRPRPKSAGQQPTGPQSGVRFQEDAPCQPCSPPPPCPAEMIRTYQRIQEMSAIKSTCSCNERALQYDMVQLMSKLGQAGVGPRVPGPSWRGYCPGPPGGAGWAGAGAGQPGQPAPAPWAGAGPGRPKSAGKPAPAPDQAWFGPGQPGADSLGAGMLGLLGNVCHGAPCIDGSLLSGHGPAQLLKGLKKQKAGKSGSGKTKPVKVKKKTKYKEDTEGVISVEEYEENKKKKKNTKLVTTEVTVPVSEEDFKKRKKGRKISCECKQDSSVEKYQGFKLETKGKGTAAPQFPPCCSSLFDRFA